MRFFLRNDKLFVMIWLGITLILSFFLLLSSFIRWRSKALFFINQFDEGLLFFDHQEKLTFYNQKALALLQIKYKKGMTARHFFQSLPEEMRYTLSDAYRRCLLNRQNESVSFSISENKIKQLTVSYTIPKGGGILLIFRDSSDLYLVQSMGKDFVSNASHELRTPITIIRGFAEMLRDMPELSSDMLEEITNKILKNCKRMSQLVKNLLVLADLDHAWTAPKEPIDLVSLIDHCSHTLLSLHPEIHLECLYIQRDLEIFGDMDLLERAILNLMENAVKYSDNDPVIKVIIDKTEDAIILKIADEGKGIAEEDLPRIFDRFYTVDRTHSRRKGGAGLGLSIVRRICELHGVNVSVESRVDEGTTFILTFSLQGKAALQTPKTNALNN